jgi:hypothetical protein
VRLYKAQEQLYAFARRLKEAQLLKREAILPTENGGYKLQLAINEIIHVPSSSAAGARESTTQRSAPDMMPKRQIS